MTASELYQSGKLAAAITAAIDVVKKSPTDTGARFLLAELFCFAGEWERADKQLDALGQQSVDAAVRIVLFRQLIRGETARQQLFSDGRLPEFLFDVTAELRLRLDALVAIRENDLAAAASLLEQAEEARAKVTGTTVGHSGEHEPFDDFRDLDDLCGSFLELLTSTGKYYWVPIDRIQKIECHPPQRAMDLIWRRVLMDVAGGPEGEVYLPTIYVGTNETGDDQLQLGRGTTWTEAGNGPIRGLGQKTFLVGSHDVPIMQLGTITFETE